MGPTDLYDHKGLFGPIKSILGFPIICCIKLSFCVCQGYLSLLRATWFFSQVIRRTTTRWQQVSNAEQNYFTGYVILLHELPVVAVLFTQSNNNEGTMKNSILHEIFCKSLFHTSRPIVKLEFSCPEINTAKALTGLDRESAHPLQLHAVKWSWGTAANIGGTGRPYQKSTG